VLVPKGSDVDASLRWFEKHGLGFPQTWRRFGEQIVVTKWKNAR
jgi:hypothetical protein